MSDQHHPGDDETPSAPAPPPPAPSDGFVSEPDDSDIPPPPGPAAPRPFLAPAPRRRRRRSWLFRLIVWALILLVAVPPAWVLVYRFIPPPITPLMVIRMTQGQGLDYRWRPLREISPALVQAAIAAEDARFCQHNGFDFAALQKAMAHNQRRPGKVRGGSTISQQTAKNVFLWPDRTWVRKAVESYFTVLIEAIWGKRRIMETYLNVVEMGPGIYGADAAARRYFGTDAAHLSNLEASRLAAIFPSPLKWRAVNPGRYVQRRSSRIGGAIQTVRTDGLAVCVGHLTGVAPSAAPLAAPPPPAAQAWVEQQQAQASPEDVPPGPDAGSSAPPDSSLPESSQGPAAAEPEAPAASSDPARPE
jgi:monofunctional biosynthetic peptidoglycan transglycosylase